MLQNRPMSAAFFAVSRDCLSLGKGEVESSILFGSTILSCISAGFRNLLLRAIALRAHSYMCAVLA